MLDNSQWQAKFISPEGEDEGDSSKGKLLRKEFNLDGEIAYARVYATALGMYELYINGKRVGNGLLTPGWTNYRERLQIKPITDMLKNNTIGSLDRLV